MHTDSLTYIDGEISDVEIFNTLPQSLQYVLSEKNGFVAFAGGLHVRGAVLEPKWHSLREVWTSDYALHKLFAAILETDIPFAQDCMGDQFILRDDEVWQLSSETGDLESLHVNLQDFFKKAEANPVEYLSLHPLLQFINEGGKLEQGQLLNAYPPFCTKEAANGVSLKAVPMFEQIIFLADFAKQISGLSKGTQFKIKIENS